MTSGYPATYQKGFHDEELVRKMRYNVLGATNLIVSHLSLGAAQLALCYGTEDEPEGIEAVVRAVKSGINYIDTAPYYGETKAETVLGKALSRLPRESYYIGTKVGRYTSDVRTMFDFSAEKTLQSVEESLQRLGLSYVDVIQVHDLEFAPSLDIIVSETLPALQKIRDSGRARFIGITGYPLKTLKKLLELSSVKIDVVLSYCRCTLFDDSLQQYIPYFKERGLGVINAAAVGMGLLTDVGPPDWHPGTQNIKTACADAAQYCKENGVDITKLALLHAFSQSGVDTHLIGMANPGVLEKNLDVLWNEPTSKERSVLEEVKARYFVPLTEKNWENVELQSHRGKTGQEKKQE